MIAVSIVSHDHGRMVNKLIDQLLLCPLVEQIIVTFNIPEQLELTDNAKIQKIENRHPKGFGDNHNWAFKNCEQPYFCVINPDIEFYSDPFPKLLEAHKSHNATLSAPLVLSPNGEVEDSARYFPTLKSLIIKAWRGDQGNFERPTGNVVFRPDWLAGMFMLFSSGGFSEIGGFDIGYFLYYEDVDICARLHINGQIIILDPSVSIIHNAHRTSRKNFKFMRWHLSSIMRFFFQHGFNLRSKH